MSAKVSERLYKVLLSPHTSEKSARVGDRHRQYVFRVMSDATKTEIKKAVEHLFKVSVEKVRTVSMPAVTVRTGRRLGTRSGWKKAYVKLGEGQEISFTGQA